MSTRLFEQVSKRAIQEDLIPRRESHLSEYSSSKWKLFSKWKKIFKKLNKEALEGLSSKEREKIYEKYFSDFCQ